MSLQPTMRRSFVTGLSAIVLAGCMARAPVDAPPASVVFFTAFSAELDDGAKGVIADAAEAARGAPSRRVVVEGFADTDGTPASNRTLSQLRAQVVADGLVARGVARDRVIIRPRGQTTADPGIESRRVDISFR